jgi:hypothetical protein
MKSKQTRRWVCNPDRPWPIQVPLLPGEAPVSWLVRVLGAHHLPLSDREGLSSLFSGSVDWMGIDDDLPDHVLRAMTAWQPATMAELSNINEIKGALTATQIAKSPSLTVPYLVRAYERFRHQTSRMPDLPLSISGNPRHRSRRDCAAYCSVCFRSDRVRYLRRIWFFHGSTCCLVHGTQLQYGCPRCHAPVKPWMAKTNAGRRQGHSPADIGVCHVCGEDLGNAPADRTEDGVLTFEFAVVAASATMNNASKEDFENLLQLWAWHTWFLQTRPKDGRDIKFVCCGFYRSFWPTSLCLMFLSRGPFSSVLKDISETFDNRCKGISSDVLETNEQISGAYLTPIIRRSTLELRAKSEAPNLYQSCEISLERMLPRGEKAKPPSLASIKRVEDTAPDFVATSALESLVNSALRSPKIREDLELALRLLSDANPSAIETLGAIGDPSAGRPLDEGVDDL